MKRSQFLAYLTAMGAASLIVYFFQAGSQLDSVDHIVFWICLLAAAELLPVTLGFETRITMGFPVALAIAVSFNPLSSMLIVGLGNFDIRELKREIPLHQAVFNRSQTMLAVAAASSTVVLIGGRPLTFPLGVVASVVAATLFILTNLGLVGMWLTQTRGLSLRDALALLVPRPAAGFWMAQALLAGLGIATAAAYERIGPFVAGFLIPLLFARLSLIGARTQQELSERLRQQQATLLKATEQVFAEREDERKRIAAEIHDGSLQMLAAASYSVGNAGAFLDAGKTDEAGQLLSTSRTAIEGAMAALRDSLVDLRRSSVEAGGLMRTIDTYVEQVSMLWGTHVHLEGGVEHEPPVPVALAAFQILQEGLVNALKHANSESITVRVIDSDNMVHIVVEDDGAGFDPEAEIGTDHVGMRLMKERAALVGGRIELHSAQGGGTRLEAVLPGGVAP
ncbi:MAG: sensor histidine kinase [Actinomycetota bacterium]